MTDHDAPSLATPEPSRPLLAKVLTVSDGVIAGTRADESGAAITACLEGAGFRVVEHRVISDGIEPVSNAISAQAYGFNGLIVTTGGTGFGPRDLTPEGTRRVLDRTAAGLSEAMRAASPKGRLSRGVSGIRGAAVVVNTAGSPAGAVEMLEAVLDVLPHAVELAGGRPSRHPA